MEVRKPAFDEAKTMMSAAAAETDGPALGASRVGAELRTARLRLGWSLEDVTHGLRIRQPYLEAIEEGRPGDLPGTAYAVGFLRSYAQALGLDADEVSRRFRAEGHQVDRKTELSFPAPVPERGVPVGAVVLLGLIIAVGGYAAWYKFSSVRHAEPTVATIPERLAPLADRVPASSVSPQVASILPAPLPAPPPLPTSSVPSTAALAAPVPAIPVPIPVPVSVTVQPPVVSSAPVDASRVVLKFKADSYIQVREKQGPVLLNRVMRSGETWPVPKEANLVMTTGNAGGTDIVVDGIVAAPLGANGAVRRDVSLEPESIKLPPGSKLPAQPRQQ